MQGMLFLSLKLRILSLPSPHLLTGAYRSNEVDNLHPLTDCIKAISAITPERVTTIELPPLDVSCVKQLLNETLYVEGSAELAALAVLIHGKTEGNPYFVIQVSIRRCRRIA